MARYIAAHDGLLLGSSSAVNLVACCKLVRSMRWKDSQRVVTTILYVAFSPLRVKSNFAPSKLRFGFAAFLQGAPFDLHSRSEIEPYTSFGTTTTFERRDYRLTCRLLRTCCERHDGSTWDTRTADWGEVCADEPWVRKLVG